MVIGANDQHVGRVFVCCYGCRRIRPYWRIVGPSDTTEQFCRCGEVRIKPKTIPEWKAAWWVLIRGMLWRKWLLRKTDWDPRMPVRTRDHALP